MEYSMNGDEWFTYNDVIGDPLVSVISIVFKYLYLSPAKPTQQTFTCSTSVIETLEKGVQCVQS